MNENHSLHLIILSFEGEETVKTKGPQTWRTKLGSTGRERRSKRTPLMMRRIKFQRICLLRTDNIQQEEKKRQKEFAELQSELLHSFLPSGCLPVVLSFILLLSCVSFCPFLHPIILSCPVTVSLPGMNLCLRIVFELELQFQDMRGKKSKRSIHDKRHRFRFFQQRRKSLCYSDSVRSRSKWLPAGREEMQNQVPYSLLLHCQVSVFSCFFFSKCIFQFQRFRFQGIERRRWMPREERNTNFYSSGCFLLRGSAFKWNCEHCGYCSMSLWWLVDRGGVWAANVK